MNPKIPEVLMELSGLVAFNAQPDVDPADRASALGLTAMLLAVAAQEFDRAAARHVEENRAVRALLARGAAVVADAALAERLRSLAATADEDLRVSALQAANSALRAGLIELHAAVEAADGAEAKALESEIWSELVVSTERRVLAGAPV